MNHEPKVTLSPLSLSQTKAKAQQQMVKDSLTRAFDEPHSGKAHRDARVKEIITI